MSITLNKKIKKRKINLIIPKGLNHNLIFFDTLNDKYYFFLLYKWKRLMTC